MMIGYDIYDRFTMEHFPLCQIMILPTSFFCSRQYNKFNSKQLTVCNSPDLDEASDNISNFSTRCTRLAIKNVRTERTFRAPISRQF
jgi:hypothetical protein